MRRALVIALTVCCAFVFTTRGADKLTDEQKAERKALIEKYDKNKDGKLDKEERQAMSAEDKEKLAKLSGGGKKKKDGDK
jgi:Ca2+-binding EF-hand superfamily protein